MGISQVCFSALTTIVRLRITQHVSYAVGPLASHLSYRLRSSFLGHGLWKHRDREHRLSMLRL
jgi:hypothetical protein